MRKAAPRRPDLRTASEAAVHALRGVTLESPAGRYSTIMGPSGSGKSTLMHLLAGLDTPSGGSVTVDGREIAGLDDKALTNLRRDRLGFVFQSFNLVPVLTAEGHAAAADARRPQDRQGVAGPPDRERRPGRPPHAPARRALRRPPAARRGGTRARPSPCRRRWRASWRRSRLPGAPRAWTSCAVTIE